MGRRPTRRPAPIRWTLTSASQPTVRVIANRYVEGLGHDNLKHNIPDLEISWNGTVRTAEFLSYHDATRSLERWGLPISEVHVLKPGGLTMLFQRGAVDFHNVGQGWTLERRLTWEYVGGVHSAGGDQGAEPYTQPPRRDRIGPLGPQDF